MKYTATAHPCFRRGAPEKIVSSAALIEESSPSSPDCISSSSSCICFIIHPIHEENSYSSRARANSMNGASSPASFGSTAGPEKGIRFALEVHLYNSGKKVSSYHGRNVCTSSKVQQCKTGYYVSRILCIAYSILARFLSADILNPKFKS